MGMFDLFSKKEKSKETNKQNLRYNGSTAIPRQSVAKITPQQIVQMAQAHEPSSIYDTDGRHLVSEVELVVSEFMPLYTGLENVAASLMMHNPEEMKSKMNDADVDTLLVFFKFLAVKAGEISNNQPIGVMQNYLIFLIQEKLSNAE